MSPQYREKDSEQEVEAAREQLKETGQASVFDAIDQIATPEDTEGGFGGTAKGKEVKKYTDVRLQNLF